MKSKLFSNNLISELDFSEIDGILDVARSNAYSYLRSFRNDAGYSQKLETAFGTGFDQVTANSLFDSFVEGDFNDIPSIEIVNRNDINGANGAFSITTGKIYLATEFISQNAQNVAAVTAILLEEIGHFVDAQINVADAAGDEGDIFARLVQGESLSQEELAVLKAEDDTATVTMDGQVVEIEKQDGSIFGTAFTAFNDPNLFTVNNGGWGSFNSYPRQLADVNGDKFADIVGFGYYGTVVALGKQNGTFGNTSNVDKFVFNDFAVTQGWESFDKHPRQLADVNGDGLADIVGFKSDGVYVALSKGNGTFENKKLAFSDPNLFTVNNGGWGSYNSYPRQLADVNGDKFADIVGFGYYGTVVALGKQNGTFGNTSNVDKFVFNDFAVTQGWESFDKHPRQLADVNGDGLADIVGFASAAIKVALAHSPSITLAVSPSSVVEDGTTNLIYTFTRTGTTTSSLTVNYGITGTANSSDYTGATPGTGKTITFAAGSSTATLTIDPTADTTVEANETVALTLAAGTGYTIGTTTAVTGTITNDDASAGYILGGYIQSGNINSTTSASTPFNKLTHLFYSFADVSSADGTVTLPTAWDNYNDIIKLQEIKTQNPHLKIMLSIGGAGELDFTSAVGDNSTLTSRQNFADTAISFVKDGIAYNTNGDKFYFDGIDIDWESPKQTENQEYLDLLKTLDQRLPAGKLLTTATMASQWFLGGRGDYKLAADLNWNGTTKSVLAHTSDIVDFINVMSYDYKATWSADTTTGHQAALGNTTTLDTVAWAVDYYKAKGVDPKDIVMGLPLYGRTWVNVTNPANNGLGNSGIVTQSFDDYNAIRKEMIRDGVIYSTELETGRNFAYYGLTDIDPDGGGPLTPDGKIDTIDGLVDIDGDGKYNDAYIDYKKLHDQYLSGTNGYGTVGTKGYGVYWDDTAKVPYIYNSQTGVFSTYEDKESIKDKTDYVKQQGIGGAFFWETPQDLPLSNPNSLISAAATNLGINGNVAPNSSPGVLLPPLSIPGGGTLFLSSSLFNSDSLGTGSFSAIRPQFVTFNLSNQPLNEITGTSGRDTLTGTSPNDRIIGLQGADTLTGGEGYDQFVYTNIRERGDTITDFEVGKDSIVLTELLNSLVPGGYNGTDPRADGYVKFVQGTSNNNFTVQIDADGSTGNDIFRHFITVNLATTGTLDNPRNFVF